MTFKTLAKGRADAPLMPLAYENGEKFGEVHICQMYADAITFTAGPFLMQNIRFGTHTAFQIAITDLAQIEERVFFDGYNNCCLITDATGAHVCTARSPRGLKQVQNQYGLDLVDLRDWEA